MTNYSLQRVAIVDFDVHQGNGTEDVIGGHKQVAYFATHQSPLYPFYDQSKDQPNNINYCAIPEGCDSEQFKQVWQEKLLPSLHNYQPELLLISAGFDAHQADPLAQCNLQTQDFTWLTGQLVKLADQHAQGRVVSSLEGGYALSALADSVAAHVLQLQG